MQHIIKLYGTALQLQPRHRLSRTRRRSATKNAKQPVRMQNESLYNLGFNPHINKYPWIVITHQRIIEKTAGISTHTFNVHFPLGENERLSPN